MRRALVLSLLVFMGPAWGLRAETDPEISSVLEELVPISQQLYDALAPGDPGPWQKHLAPDGIIVDEEGGVTTKAEFLEHLRPLPPGFTGHIDIDTTTVRKSNDVVVMTHRLKEYEQIFGQEINVEYQATHVFVHRDRKWQLLAVHHTVLPSPRKAADIDPDVFTPCLGVYELAPEFRFTIYRDGDRILGRRNDRQPTELLPASENVLFRKGNVRAEMIFVRNAQGRVDHMIARRDNNDIIWKKVE